MHNHQTRGVLLALLAIIALALSACGSAPTIAPTVVPTAVPPAAPATAPVVAATQPPSGSSATLQAADTLVASVKAGVGVAGNGSAQWPSKMPADVPQFTYGTLTASNNNVMGAVQATFANVSADAFSKYQADLKQAGWTITTSSQTSDGFEIDASQGSQTLVAMFVLSKNSGLKGALTVHPGK